jgi:hypothetical protein
VYGIIGGGTAISPCLFGPISIISSDMMRFGYFSLIAAIPASTKSDTMLGSPKEPEVSIEIYKIVGAKPPLLVIDWNVASMSSAVNDGVFV